VTYLQLCARLRQEAGISGNGPTSVLNQTGPLSNVINWIQQAWIDIQQKRPNWLFMNAEFIFDTIANQRDYIAADFAITDLKLWDLESFLLYNKSVGVTDQKKIIFLDYSYWRNFYRAQMDARPADRIQYLTVLANNTIRFEPKPDTIYTIEGEYKKSTQIFSADADTPTGLPDDFHMIIVWQALKTYAHFEDAPEVLSQAEINFDNLLNRLEIEQLPAFSEDREPLA